MPFVRLFCELINTNVLITVPSVHQVVKTNVWKMDLINYASVKQLTLMDRAYISVIC